MRATVMFKAGDVRVEDVPDPVLREPTDAIVRITRSCICGSDLWPYQSMPVSDEGRRMGSLDGRMFQRLFDLCRRGLNMARIA